MHKAVSRVGASAYRSLLSRWNITPELRIILPTHCQDSPARRFLQNLSRKIYPFVRFRLKLTRLVSPATTLVYSRNPLHLLSRKYRYSICLTCSITSVLTLRPEDSGNKWFVIPHYTLTKMACSSGIYLPVRSLYTFHRPFLNLARSYIPAVRSPLPLNSQRRHWQPSSWTAPS